MRKERRGYGIKENKYGKSHKTHHDSLPKLPSQTYNKTLKEFLDYIREEKFPVEIRKRLLKKYKQVQALNRGREESTTPPGISKLSDFQKMEIIELAGRYFSPSQIMDIIRNEWRIKYSNASLNNLLNRNKEVIYDKRTKYVSNVDSLRLVHERPRIEELSEIYEEARENHNPKLAIEALKEIRQEVKGDSLRIEGNMNMNVNVNVKEHILKEIDIHQFGRLALMKILDKHGIDFLSIAHRFKTIHIDKDPKTGEEIDKMVPVPLEGVGLLPAPKVKRMLEAEEAKFVDDVDEVKKILKDKLVKKMRGVHDLKMGVDLREDMDPPEILEKMKTKAKNKKRKGMSDDELKAAIKKVKSLRK